MNSYLLLPLLLGVSVVVQATMNRQLGSQYGWATAVTLNAVVFLVLSLGFLLIAKYTPSLIPEFLQNRRPTDSFHLSYFIPGMCGFFLVLGLPLSMQFLGASTSIILLIASQILFSVAQEAWTAGLMPSLWNFFGAILVLAGSALVVRFQ